MGKKAHVMCVEVYIISYFFTTISFVYKISWLLKVSILTQLPVSTNLAKIITKKNQNTSKLYLLFIF